MKRSFPADDDFCFSNENSFDTLTSDGVHLLLCGTKEYSYNSIFFFPKAVAGKIEAIACDVLSGRNVISGDALIKTKFAKTEQGYIITAVLGNVSIWIHIFIWVWQFPIATAKPAAERIN